MRTKSHNQRASFIINDGKLNPVKQSLTDRLADRRSADGWGLGLIPLCSGEVASGSFRYPAGTAALLFQRGKKFVDTSENLPPPRRLARGKSPGVTSNKFQSHTAPPLRRQNNAQHICMICCYSSSQARNIRAAPGSVSVLRRGAAARGGGRRESRALWRDEQQGGSLNWSKVHFQLTEWRATFNNNNYNNNAKGRCASFFLFPLHYFVTVQGTKFKGRYIKALQFVK